MDLEAQCELFSTLLSNIDGVVWAVDLPTMAICYVNAAVEDLYGYGAEAFLSDSGLWWRLIYAADRPRLESCLNQLNERDRFDVEYRITRADGEIRWVRDRSRVVHGPDGTPVRLNRITTDITDQKEMEEALRHSESQLRAIFQQAAIGINQATLDGRFVQVNQAYCDLLGYSEAELLQMGYQDLAHPDEFQATAEALAKLHAREATSVTLEKRYFHRDGSLRWTNLVLSILRDADGQAISDLAIVQDITDRKRIEQALEEERSLFVGGPTMVVRWGATADWPVEYISPNVQAQLGYTPEALLNGQVTFAALIHPADLEQVQTEVATATVAQKVCYAQQYRVRHANGEYRWIDDFTRVIYGPGGKVVQFLGYIQDITDRKQTELALQESEATKQAMLAAIPDLLIRINRQGMCQELFSGGEITLYSGANPQLPQSIYTMLPRELADRRIHFTGQALDTGMRQIYEAELEIEGRHYHEETRIVPMNGEEALVMVRDVTDRATAERALRESQQRFQAIFNQMYQFIGLLTPEGIMLEANQTALDFAGLTRAEVVGRPFWATAWWQEAERPQLQRAIAAAAQGEFVRYEVVARGANQQTIPLDFSLRPVCDDQGQVVLLIPEGRDLSQRKQMEEELQRTQIFLEQTNTVAQVGGWEMDLQQDLIHWTPLMRAIYEVEEDFQPTPTTVLDLVASEEGRQRLRQALEQARQTGQPWDEKLQIVTAKGNYRWVRSLGQAEFLAGTCVRLFGALQDIEAQMQTEVRLQELTQQLQQANAELHRMAITDDLTQVANRRYFDQRLAQEWTRAQRKGTSLALIVCDVDYFKPYNDNYGHLAGDRCLQQVAQLLQEAVQRSGDVLARYGGEEFVVLMSETTIAGAIAVVTKIQAHLAQARLPHKFSAVADHITLSYGITCCIPQPQILANDLFAAADAALYQAKLQGRNQYYIGTLSGGVSPGDLPSPPPQI